MKEVRWGTWEIGGPRHYYREGLILRTLREVQSAGRILDVGCGTGSLITKLARIGYIVDGVDLSEECLTLTRSRVSDAGLNDMIRIKHGSVTAIPYADGYFDGVIAAEVLEHIDDDIVGVREICRVLKSGGVCIVTVPANSALWDLSDEMAGHRRRYDREGLCQVMKAGGLPVERINYLGFPIMRLYNRLVFLSWAKKTSGDGKVDPNQDLATKVGLHPITSLILGNLFRIDNLFSIFPWGIGILLVARKPVSVSIQEGR